MRIVSFGSFIFVIGIHQSVHSFHGIDGKNESILKSEIRDFFGGIEQDSTPNIAEYEQVVGLRA